MIKSRERSTHNMKSRSAKRPDRAGDSADAEFKTLGVFAPTELHLFLHMMNANGQPEGDEDVTDFFQELSAHWNQRRSHPLPSRTSSLVSDTSSIGGVGGASAIDAIETDDLPLGSGALPVRSLSASAAAHEAPASEADHSSLLASSLRGVL